MNAVYYETGIETLDVSDHGSRFFIVLTTKSEDEAFKAYKEENRNYLYKITHSPGAPRIIEWWSEWEQCWRK